MAAAQIQRDALHLLEADDPKTERRVKMVHTSAIGHLNGKARSLDLVIVGGCPGSGKTTICRELWTRWNVVPMIDFGQLRSFHLDREWKNESAEEESIAFDHLVHIVHNYVAHNFRPVLVHDLRDYRVTQTELRFGNLNYRIVTLVCPDEVIAKRVSGRNEGFTNVSAALEWNRIAMNRPLVAREVRIANVGDLAVIVDEIESSLFR